MTTRFAWTVGSVLFYTQIMHEEILHVLPNSTFLSSREHVEFPNTSILKFHLHCEKMVMIKACTWFPSQVFDLLCDPWMTGTVSSVTSPWHPHIPDARRANTTSPQSAPLCWSFAELALVGRKSKTLKCHMIVCFTFCVCVCTCVQMCVCACERVCALVYVLSKNISGTEMHFICGFLCCTNFKKACSSKQVEETWVLLHEIHRTYFRFCLKRLSV